MIMLANHESNAAPTATVWLSAFTAIREEHDQKECQTGVGAG